MKQRVYICGPYSDGDTICHVKRACAVADLVLAKGGIPFIPHLCHFWHFLSPKDKNTWLMIDKEMLYGMHCIVIVDSRYTTEGMIEELKHNADHLYIPVYTEKKVREPYFQFAQITE